MASAASVFIVGTILLAHVAPNAADQVLGEVKLLDVDVIFMNSGTFQREGFEEKFGRCCCDKPAEEGVTKSIDRLKDWATSAKKDRVKERTLRCGFKMIDSCGMVPLHKNGGPEWAKKGLHEYSSTEGKKCEVDASELEPLIKYFREMDHIVLNDMYAIMSKSDKFIKEGLKNFKTSEGKLKRCCCDKPSSSWIDSKVWIESNVERSGRCALFDTSKECTPTSMPSWSKGGLHSHDNTTDGKCAITEKDLQPLKDFFFENGPDDIISSSDPLQAFSPAGAAGDVQLVDIHSLFMNSQTFQREGFGRFGRCCCDKPAGDLKDWVTGLSKQMKKERPVDRHGRCGIFPSGACGEIPLGPLVGGPTWTREGAPLHEYVKTPGRTCEVEASELEPLISYFREQDHTVLHDLDSIMAGNEEFMRAGLESFIPRGWGKSLKKRAAQTATRCCCDKASTTLTKKNVEKVVERTGRCGLFQTKKCGSIYPHWAKGDVHVYTSTKEAKCSLTEFDLAPVLKFFFSTNYCAEVTDGFSVQSAAYGETRSVDCGSGRTANGPVTCGIYRRFTPQPRCD